MKNIIVTVTNVSKSYLYDLEVPTELPVEKLKSDIVATLNGYRPDLSLREESAALYCNRIGRRLASEETCESAGIWNGDYITLIEVPNNG